MSTSTVTLYEWASKCYELLRSDRDVVIGVGGFTGEGKSCFTTQLLKQYAKVAKVDWGFDNITWSRKELMTWIDGEKKSTPDPVTGLKKNQLPEYSAVLPDELFYMFYKRTWYMDDQISAVATFNMCRDRHLLVAGNVPDMWDLDGSFLKRVRFYIYIPERGKAWVFEQENNPFSKDPWNVTENKKLFRKYKNPFSVPNFICQINYGDWSAEEKAQYYKVRNKKRVLALNESKGKIDKYRDIKDQRDEAIRGWFEDRRQLAATIKKIPLEGPGVLKEWHKPMTYASISQLLGIDSSWIRVIKAQRIAASSRD